MLIFTENKEISKFVLGSHRNTGGYHKMVTTANASFLYFHCSCHISSFIKSKYNLCADMKQKFTAVRKEAAACLHDTLVSLER